MTGGSKVPDGLFYTRDHEWVRVEAGQITVGITDHAQAELTDVVYADLPSAGKDVRRRETVLTLESVKTVAEVYAPIDGRLVGSNEELRTHPELINQEPYGRGWIFQMTSKDKGPVSGLMSATEYRAFLDAPSPADAASSPSGP